MSNNPQSVPAASVPHVLITAGPTRERIDEVRDWGNIFTGTTGLELARSFVDLGNVTLLTSNEAHAREYDGYSGRGGMIGAELFRAHGDLEALLEERMTSGVPVDVVAMSAAVADYRPAGVYRVVERRAETDETRDARSQASPATNEIAARREVWVVEDVSAGKVKSHFDEIAIRGVRTVKLVDRFRRDWGFGGILIKFKLEVGLTDAELLRVAEASRVASGADLMVANTLAMARPQDGQEGGAYLVDDQGARRVPRGMLAQEVRQWTMARLKEGTSKQNPLKAP